MRGQCEVAGRLGCQAVVANWLPSNPDPTGSLTVSAPFRMRPNG